MTPISALSVIRSLPPAWVKPDATPSGGPRAARLVYDSADERRDRHRARPGRLAAARRAAVRRRPLPLRGRPGRRLAALAQRTRDPVPRAPPVAPAPGRPR